VSFVSLLVGRLWRLPAPTSRDIAIEALRIPMCDGLELLADRYYPVGSVAQPTLLIRSCYGRGNLFKHFATLFAERGMQVVVQSCRADSVSSMLARRASRSSCTLEAPSIVCEQLRERRAKT